MKKMFLILQRIWSIVIILVAVAFIIIEGRLVFSGDWMLYENAFFGCMQYVFRLLLAIIALGIGVLPWIRIKNAVIPVTLYGAIALFGMSCVLVLYTTNYVGEVFWGISGVYLILSMISRK